MVFVQEKEAASLGSPEGSAALVRLVNQSLAALSEIDQVLAATENADGQPSAAIWHALATGDSSVQQALALSESHVEALALQRKRCLDFGAVAPLAVAFFAVVPNLRPGCTGVLLEVRSLRASVSLREACC